MEPAQRQALPAPQSSVLVCALQLDGRGDIYGAHEIALRVKRLMPHLKVVFTVLQPRLGDEERNLFSQTVFENAEEIIKQEGWSTAPERKALRLLNTFKRIIVFPTYQDSMLPPEILMRNEDVIKLREYGVGNPTPGLVNGPTYTLGLAKAKGEKGVLLPMEFSQKLPAYKEKTPLQRLSYLQKVNPALSCAILGEHFSLEAIQKFHRSHKLYLGYFSQYGIFFCYINALMRCKEGNLVICTTKKRPEWLIEEIQQTALEKGFGTIRIFEFTNAEEANGQIYKFPNTKNEKTCTLIFRPLSGTEMNAMLDATEDESLTTGDNSPLRFMAHRKTIVYDTRKQKIGYAQAMIELAAKFDPRFKELLFTAFFGQLEPLLDPSKVIEIEDGMVAFFNAMKDPSLKANWHRFIEEIFANNDFAPELDKILQERFK